MNNYIEKLTVCSKISDLTDVWLRDCGGKLEDSCVNCNDFELCKLLSSLIHKIRKNEPSIKKYEELIDHLQGMIKCQIEKNLILEAMTYRLFAIIKNDCVVKKLLFYTSL